jgi:hypothetical protein
MPILSHDELKAAEAAFRGQPVNPKWTVSAQEIYHGIVARTGGRDIVASVSETVTEIDEPVGAGSVILSSTDPNFRAWTVGMQQVLWNAVLGPEAFSGVAARAGSAARADKEKAARSAAVSIAALESPLRISVPATSAEEVKALLGRYGATYTIRQTGSKTTFLIANPGGLTGDDHPFAATLAGDLAAAGMRVLAFKAP